MPYVPADAVGRAPTSHRRADPPVYLWRDQLTCGHVRTIETFIPWDRDQPWEPPRAQDPSGLVGSPTICFACVPKNYDVKITQTRRLTPEEVAEHL